MRATLSLACLASLFAFSAAAQPQRVISSPVVKDRFLDFTPVAIEPDIVTPIGIAADGRGRLFVIESHTHFPKADYAGPKRDRVKLFTPGSQPGGFGKISIFADDLYHAMNVAFSPAGELYLVHRNGVLILHDRDGDGVSEARTPVLELDTPGNYPHNGLGGIAFRPDGWLYVGFGENLGPRYTLKGSDGSILSGGGEGGNIFRCRFDGSRLERVATGFWNPFALEFDRAGHLFAADNDPDSRPPCRLVHVIERGDYGFKFKFGRNGLHPFLSWNGELPGTLPMVAGTGEAPCAVVDLDRARLPERYHGHLLVTSWGDHTIEVFKPLAHGASFRAEREVIIEGDENFRPVGAAVAADGSIYITDWVDKSYNVHGRGRIWRLSAVPGVPNAPAPPYFAPRDFKPDDAPELISRMRTPGDFPVLLRLLADADAFNRSAAVGALAAGPFTSSLLSEATNPSPAVRLGVLLALRKGEFTNNTDLLARALADADESVRRIALVWTGETTNTALATNIVAALNAGPVSPVLFQTYSATAAILAKALGTNAPAIGDALASASASVQALALQSGAKVDEEKFIGFLTAPRHKDELQLRLEAARTLGELASAKAVAALKGVALNTNEPAALRADAIVALAGQPADVLASLIGLEDDASPAVRTEVIRAFRTVAQSPLVRAALERTLLRNGGRDAAFAEQVQFALKGAAAFAATRPASEEDWRKALAENGDSERGRRVFFSAALGCSRCHHIEGHGGHIGPDLSTIARAANREKLMYSILKPSRDIAPQFVTQIVETKDDQSYTGLLEGVGPDGSLTLLTADGKGVLIPAAQIKSHIQSKLSLMPEGLEQGMTVQDFRDLIAFLLSRI
ncbi:MAG: c-type cytochrome [Verrucomicrobia bacterium]|nr:c-type cytochrome [Verrucomicrobiota bacterium]